MEQTSYQTLSWMFLPYSYKPEEQAQWEPLRFSTDDILGLKTKERANCFRNYSTCLFLVPVFFELKKKKSISKMCCQTDKKRTGRRLLETILKQRIKKKEKIIIIINKIRVANFWN